jgi:hypothetical protein
MFYWFLDRPLETALLALLIGPLLFGPLLKQQQQQPLPQQQEGQQKPPAAAAAAGRGAAATAAASALLWGRSGPPTEPALRLHY